MCLDLTKESKVLTARKDIPVVKWLCPNGNGQLNSPYYSTTWSRRGTKTVPHFTGMYGVILDDTLGGAGNVINAGLHSYSVRRGRKEVKEGGNHYEAVIPKGTKYIRGANGEVVSLALRLTGKRFR